MLIDSFGRTINYLRVSITDRCNLRCLYCMPPEGVEWKHHNSILTFEEIIRIVKIITDLGIRNVKVTGGEPFLRRGISSLLKRLKIINGIEKITLTTNGILLGEYLNETETEESPALPDGVNISLDALEGECYGFITGSDNKKNLNTDIKIILRNIDRLLEKKVKVKINCVPVRNVNEKEIIPIAALAKDKNITVRFIELMPIGCAANYQYVKGDEAAEKIEKAFGMLSPGAEAAGNGPAVYYSLAGFKGKIGFINAVTSGFCDSCNRLRLTSEGFLKLCLSNNAGLDLRQMLRSGVKDNDISQAIINIVKQKPKNHTLSDIYSSQEENKESMSKIGG